MTAEKLQSGILKDLHSMMKQKQGSSLAFKPEDIGRKNRAAAVAAGRAKAEAILAVCAHHPHKLLVVDEGAALRMLELLRP